MAKVFNIFMLILFSIIERLMWLPLLSRGVLINYQAIYSNPFSWKKNRDHLSSCFCQLSFKAWFSYFSSSLSCSDTLIKNLFAIRKRLLKNFSKKYGAVRVFKALVRARTTLPPIFSSAFFSFPNKSQTDRDTLFHQHNVTKT